MYKIKIGHNMIILTIEILTMVVTLCINKKTFNEHFLLKIDCDMILSHT